MTEADHDSNPTSSTSGAAPAAPVKRPRGRPRKNPLPAEGGSSAPAAPRTPRAKPAAAVPRDRPSEWTIPRLGAAEAVAPLLRSAELEPTSAEVRWDLARAYQKTGRTIKAADELQQAIRMKPEIQKRILK